MLYAFSCTVLLLLTQRGVRCKGEGSRDGRSVGEVNELQGEGKEVLMGSDGGGGED